MHIYKGNILYYYITESAYEMITVPRESLGHHDEFVS